MPKDEPAAIKPSSASESRGMKDPDQLWALDIEPDLDALDDDMKKYFDICRDKLGLLPNVLRAYQPVDEVGTGHKRPGLIL